MLGELEKSEADFLSVIQIAAFGGYVLDSTFHLTPNYVLFNLSTLLLGVSVFLMVFFTSESREGLQKLTGVYRQLYFVGAMIVAGGGILFTYALRFTFINSSAYAYSIGMDAIFISLFIISAGFSWFDSLVAKKASE